MAHKQRYWSYATPTGTALAASPARAPGGARGAEAEEGGRGGAESLLAAGVPSPCFPAAPAGTSINDTAASPEEAEGGEATPLLAPPRALDTGVTAASASAPLPQPSAAPPGALAKGLLSLVWGFWVLDGPKYQRAA